MDKDSLSHAIVQALQNLSSLLAALTRKATLEADRIDPEKGGKF